MHPDISAFPRVQFYCSKHEDTDRKEDSKQLIFTNNDAEIPVLLKDARDMKKKRKWDYPNFEKRAVWINVQPKRLRQKKGSNVNEAEAQVLLRHLDAFVRWAKTNPIIGSDGSKYPWEVGVLTFYKGQEGYLRKELQHKTKQWGNFRNFRFGNDNPYALVTLCTVDRFQGHEADIVFLSFVKTGKSVGFLNSPNRLNVALTRARYQIVLIGSQTRFSESNSHLMQSLANSDHYSSELGWEVSNDQS